jgi:hypothetical protein
MPATFIRPTKYRGFDAGERTLTADGFGVDQRQTPAGGTPTGSARPILLKDSLSVQRRFLSFMEMQPKIRGKHDVRLIENV